MQSFYDPETKVWSGLKAMPMYHENCSIGRVIYKTLKSNPSNICEINADNGNVTTNQDMLNWSVRIAQHLQNRNIGRDDIIGLISKPSTYETAVVLAAFYNTTPFHALNPQTNAESLKKTLSITKPKLIFCDAVDYERIKKISSTWEREIITLTEKVDGVVFVQELLEPTQTEIRFQPQPLTQGKNQTMAILCSSGTIGAQKAICIANSLLLQMMERATYSSQKIIFTDAGLDWITGLRPMIESIVTCCTRIITNQDKNTENLIKLIKNYKVNIFMTSSYHFSELTVSPLVNSESLASLDMIFISGGWLSNNSLHNIQQQLAKSAVVIFSYGSTEISTISTNSSCMKFGNSVGQLIPGAQGRIVSDDGINLGPKEIGEIYIHKENYQWLGYYGNPIESQKLFDSDGWFHTGDLGYFDEHNNLFIIDRKTNTYICNGHQYWPNQIESVLAELPEVQEVCVVGITINELGEIPAAMVVLRPGKWLDEEHIKTHMANVVNADYMQLHGGVYFTDFLPKNNNGKVLRHYVRYTIMKGKEI